MNVPTQKPRLLLVRTITEKYVVTEEAFRQIPEGWDRDARLIELFEMYDGSQYGDRLFYDDASGPDIGVEFKEVDDEW